MALSHNGACLFGKLDLLSFARYPPLKRWAIFDCPSGAKASGKQRPGGTADKSPVFQHRVR
ncbi:MAG: hypothetical protein D3922_07415, partial [Candidatus Electrothrix sp. AR1]|nr:hypothetical protein [Candidatus Electrothrix sp. AR1]